MKASIHRGLVAFIFCLVFVIVAAPFHASARVPKVAVAATEPKSGETVSSALVSSIRIDFTGPVDASTARGQFVFYQSVSRKGQSQKKRYQRTAIKGAVFFSEAGGTSVTVKVSGNTLFPAGAKIGLDLSIGSVGTRKKVKVKRYVIYTQDSSGREDPPTADPTPSPTITPAPTATPSPNPPASPVPTPTSSPPPSPTATPVLPEPQALSLPAYQGPSSGGPGDVLLLSGLRIHDAQAVVYQRVELISDTLTAPREIPAVNTSGLGRAKIVSRSSSNDNISVQLPVEIGTDRPSAMWILGANGAWSRPIIINDALPIWFSPRSTTTMPTRTNSSLRYIKVVGRNLHPIPGARTRVRLTSGSSVYLLDSELPSPTTTSRHYYSAKAKLPEQMTAGSYRVEVQRDGVNWKAVSDRTFEVRVPEATPRMFSPQAFGGCLPSDGMDDTACIVQAIAAARDSGGGDVYFSAGEWSLLKNGVLGVDPLDGMIVPLGVNLIGAGPAVSAISRGTKWNVLPDNPSAWFTLLGQNVVQGLTFRDQRQYQTGDWDGPSLRLGRTFYRVTLTPDVEAHLIRAVSIRNNRFERAFIAIGDGGLPITDLTITGNVIGAFFTGILFEGSNGNALPFRLDDAIITENTFKPGSYFDPVQYQGTIATQIGASRRVDFSDNIADGTSTEFLNDPVNDRRGWRAAFFWHMRNNIEQLLISGNGITCSGDKAGDGEAIVLDNNANTFALKGAVAANATDANSVTVGTVLEGTQNGVRVPSAYYKEHWVQIVDGPGIGQARRITAIDTSVAGQTTFRIAPRWDVIPSAGLSKLVVAHVGWQIVTVDNISDQRTSVNGVSKCTKGNATRVGGGLIGYSGLNSDSVIDGNHLFDTDGLMTWAAYSAGQYGNWISTSYFLEMRRNNIIGEYDWQNGCSWSGLKVIYGAAPDAGTVPPALTYGLTLNKNLLDRSTGMRGGAIDISPSWYIGPPGTNWPLIRSSVIYSNQIQNLTDPPPNSCNKPSRSAINIVDPSVDSSVVHANYCAAIGTGNFFRDGGRSSQVVCEAKASNSCECR